MTIPEAMAVFVHGHCHGRSRTYPYVPTFIGGLWVMQDAPRKDPRKVEVVAHAMSPSEIVAEVKRQGLGWHFLSVISETEDETKLVKKEMKALGYRAVSTEWLFVHDLAKIPPHESDPPARHVPNQAMLDLVPQTVQKGHQQRIRDGRVLFGVWNDSRELGWVESVRVGEDAWVSGLYVWADVRRHGYGRALMTRLLEFDRDRGLGHSVLLASSAGAKLYPLLGYEQIGILQMFCPVSRS